MTNLPVARDTRPASEPAAPGLLIWMCVALLALSVPLAFNLLTRARNETTTLQEVLRMREEARLTEIRRDQVKAALDHAATDAFTEQYARAYLRWARPGDTVVVPAAPSPTRKWWEDFVK